MPLKLGKNPAVVDTRDLRLGKYVDVAAVLPQIPKTFSKAKGITFPMCGNGPDHTVSPGFQGAGDCVFAGADHETQIWLKSGGHAPGGFSGKTAIHDYSAVTGYVVGDDETDQGTNVRDALNYRRKAGVVDGHGVRHKIGAYVALDPGNVSHVLVALYLFQAVGIGIEFPDSAMSQFNQGKGWTVVPGSRIEGGHYVPVVARPLKVVTWGKQISMTQGFFSEYCDEAYAILSPEMINAKTHKTVDGFDLATLQKDLAAL